MRNSYLSWTDRQMERKVHLMSCASQLKRNRKFLKKFSPPKSSVPASVRSPLPLPQMPIPTPAAIPPPVPVNLDPQHSAPESEPAPIPDPPAPIHPITLRRSGDQWNIAPPITLPMPPSPPMIRAPVVSPIIPGSYYPHPMFPGYPYMPYQGPLVPMLPSSWPPHCQS